MRLLIAFLTITLSLNAASFSKSKKLLLKKVYHDNKITFYCENPYEIKRVNGKEKTLIIQDKKYYTPRNKYYKSGKINTRAKRVEWEHIMPAHNFGKHLPCWREGGRKACRKDKTFKAMEADMHNLVPAIGEVNGDRSNYRYGANIPKATQYGNCQFEVDFKAKRAYPKEDIRGNIARVYFYMSDKYNVRLSKQERKMMEAWDKQDPVSEWERVKNKRIQKIQGNSNSYIK
ncbi:DNA-specific endonuclease I [Malaciobacter marinus]|uniref:DNA-specific endonuclease I n=1 Tax=Malaciobacter marinus TaxID=505249 RepID=A0A347TMM3_9BACT|nr:endonuclease [Malaciobacter marinus]AXX87851.1 DNA-specific endonuclease I [Malaciobacter marinus]PHO16135.1 deoxyribonuclease [Malaciobacter marinus]